MPWPPCRRETTQAHLTEREPDPHAEHLDRRLGGRDEQCSVPCIRAQIVSFGRTGTSQEIRRPGHLLLRTLYGSGMQDRRLVKRAVGRPPDARPAAESGHDENQGDPACASEDPAGRAGPVSPWTSAGPWSLSALGAVHATRRRTTYRCCRPGCAAPGYRRRWQRRC